MFSGYWFVNAMYLINVGSNYYQVLTVWGLIGAHTNKFGFKHAWEIW